jgi:hypothetical protein
MEKHRLSEAHCFMLAEERLAIGSYRVLVLLRR